MYFTFQIKANGVHAAQLETQLNNDPFEDLPLQLLSASKFQSSFPMSPVIPLNQKDLAKLPSATESFGTLAKVNSMPAMPHVPMFNTPEEHIHISSNPFVTRLNSTNPFTEKTVSAGNPFRIETQESGVTTHDAAGGLAATPVPPLKYPSCHKGKSTFYVNTFEDHFSLQSSSSVPNNAKGWVTFEEEDLNVKKLKSLDNPVGLERSGSLQTNSFPDSLSTEQNISTLDWTVYRGSDSFPPLPARPPPAPPVPSRTSSTKSVTRPCHFLGT